MLDARYSMLAVIESPAFGLFLFKFAAPAIAADFRPSRVSRNIFTTYLNVCAWPGCMSAAFALVVLGLYCNKEPALPTFFIIFHTSPHFLCFFYSIYFQLCRQHFFSIVPFVSLRAKQRFALQSHPLFNHSPFTNHHRP
jgi:hypothetical protein